MRFARVIDELPVADFDKVALQQRFEVDPKFERALSAGFDITSEFGEKLRRRIDDEDANLIIEAFGIGGIGKSSVVFTVSKMFLDKEFGVKNCFFGKEDLLANLNEFKPRSTVHLDENVLEYGLGKNRRESEYENVINTVRKYQLSLSSCAVVPRLKQYAHYALEPLFIDREKRETRVAIHLPEVTGGYVSYGLLGWITVRDPKLVLPPEFFVEYESRKDEFIKETLHKGSGDYYLDCAREIIASSAFVPLIEFYGGRKTPRLPPRQEIIEVVNLLFPELKRNNEADAIARRVLFELKFNPLQDGNNEGVRAGVKEGGGVKAKVEVKESEGGGGKPDDGVTVAAVMGGGEDSDESRVDVPAVRVGGGDGVVREGDEGDGEEREE